MRKMIVLITDLLKMIGLIATPLLLPLPLQPIPISANQSIARVLQRPSWPPAAASDTTRTPEITLASSDASTQLVS